MAIEGVNGNIIASYQAIQESTASAGSAETATDVVSTDKIIPINPTAGKAVTTPADKEDTVYNSEQEETQQEDESTNNTLRKAVENINKQLMYTECQFGFHDATNRIIIKIIDKNSKEVLKEFPPEKTLEMIAKAWELAGILVDEKL